MMWPEPVWRRPMRIAALSALCLAGFVGVPTAATPVRAQGPVLPFEAVQAAPLGGAATAPVAVGGLFAGWLQQSEVLARAGLQSITTYDVLLNLAYDRLLFDRELGPPPDRAALRAGLGRVLLQRVLLDAAERQGLAAADAARVAAMRTRLLERWSDGDPMRFWREVGLPVVALEMEARRRSIVQRYIQDILMPTLQVPAAAIDAEYARTVTAWGGLDEGFVRAEIARRVGVEALQAELRRAAVRYLDRQPVEVLAFAADPLDLMALDAGPSLDPMDPGGLP